MDQRVFGPYYGTPPEKHTHDSATVQAFHQPVHIAPTTRTSLMQRLMTRRKPRTPNTRP